MKRSHSRNVTFILLGALLLALAIYPRAIASGQDFGLKDAWERVREAVGSPAGETGLPAGILGLQQDGSQPESARAQLEQARQRALDAGSYAYEAEVRQKTYSTWMKLKFQQSITSKPRAHLVVPIA